MDTTYFLPVKWKNRMSGLSISTVVSGELRNPSGLQKNELEARPVYVWKKEHIETHFLTCFIALTITRILEMKLEHKYSIEGIIASLTKAECSLL